MKRLHIIGRKNNGKTTLVVDLLRELATRGLRVGSIKHTHHDHQLDVPGKDSHRHQQAGAAVVGVLSRSMSALFIPTHDEMGASDRYEILAPAYRECDLVLVEGDVETPAPKIEVWRAAMGSPPIAGQVDGVLALVTDDQSSLDLPSLPRSDIAGLADWILRYLIS
ncbi:molybdopterin-guanine dinucleotide biosynthesis protein B [Aeoliella sp. ICT_H6.2]|uniref:Molybdopterin-guanine dinucleotide biosynthesis protein B n=1 Tax=Aeoliella straminimaris TaxID=2954799 RepID=A0A9X2JH84_9BACT|nr:molybdopterin-guanine dinucleotide biosynthesis protein B [Aeoliella straminimaris]MCO6044368.1 molybdopterin-guanine dinucleotide biosynthesis protein B [Aeoliella straminimaris]